MEQQLPELRHQRERPHAGLRLGRIGHNLDVLAVKVARRDGTQPAGFQRFSCMRADEPWECDRYDRP